MKTRHRQVAVLLSIVVLLGGTTPLPAGMHHSGPGLMPPHPRLLEEYEAGRMPVPDFITNPNLWRAKGIDSPAAPTSLLGSLNALAVVVDFSDKVKTVTATYFDTLIFAVPVAGRGSVYDYFDEVSYGQIDIVTVTLPSSMGWIRAPQTYAYYVDGAYCINGGYPNNCQKLAEDIVDAVNSVVNFDNYDNNNDGYAEPIMLIHAGRGAEYTGSVNDVWSHSWSLHTPRNYDGVRISSYVIMPEYWSTVSASTSDMTIGVFAHEMGHGFWGLPDLYDRDYSSRGVGRWSLMAGGSWNGGSAAGGDSPAWPDAWSRVQMGILSPTDISTNTTGRSIPQALSNPSPAETVLKLDSAALGAQEYYLVENRQQVSGAYDQYLPGEGLFIWHIDEAMWSYSLQNDYECKTQPNYTCSDSAHYLVRLAQADGLLDLENKTDSGDTGDPFPGSTVNRTFTMLTDPESSSYYSSAPSCIGVTNISNSLDTMTADVQVSCALPPTAPSGLSATPISAIQIDLTWSDLSSDETNFHIERSPNGSTGWTEIGTSPANTPAYSSTSLTCGTPYYYRVRAYRAGDNQYSAYSNTADATTTDCYKVYLPLILSNYAGPAAPPPTAPAGLSATPISASQINLTWSDLSSDETNFHIERSPNGSSGWTEIGTSPANTPAHSSMSLTCGTPYYYRVRAYRAGDDQYSAYSNTANATTSACPGFNGDFELGPAGWSESSTHGWPLIINTGFPGSVAPHGGSWAVWLGGDYDDVSTITQSVTVPVGSPYLGYWHWIASEDWCGYDYGSVRVGATLVDALDLCDTNNTGGWVHRVMNLSAYAGMTVNLQIGASTDSSLNSNRFIDDVAFQASPSPLATGTRHAPVPWDLVPRIAVGQEDAWIPETVVK